MDNGFYDEMTKKNIGVFSKEEQEVLKKTCVAIAAVGGQGSITADALARLGVGHIKITDPDRYEVSNINRQLGASTETIGKKKVDVVGDMLLKINPGLRLEKYDGITEDNVNEFVESASIVVEVIDFFAFKEKVLVHQAARRKGLYAMTATSIGFATSTLFVFKPDGMTFEEYFSVKDSKEAQESRLPLRRLCPWIPGGYSKEAVGITQKIVKEKGSLPNIGITCYLAASVLASEVMLLLLQKRDPVVVPGCVAIDLVTLKMEIIDDMTKVVLPT